MRIARPKEERDPKRPAKEKMFNVESSKTFILKKVNEPKESPNIMCSLKLLYLKTMNFRKNYAVRRP